ncbi:zinc-dependent alcohol dehydrogenase [Brachybacterium fresconis]|uniref:Threonine dehydrogenase-like Zn-dependent dehydrogenase n=1 Tax=Brachybacterium fresconis TaxID=173363 RepID=A0ABS4YMN3_9MICO|nr:alcohol dehydrogenase catalytic domain-containing protein [Brachybacterium fresconis]MBP2410051.1 threonine dehydrogenase-like Zn-dependent dehydrogenase [Brachybacterium fresconis]
MRALVITGPGEAAAGDVAPPLAAPGEVVVDVQRVGICGTDLEFFAGSMAYLRSGHARFPMRIGHEWMGTVSQLGDGVDPGWSGRRVMGDTMLGCGRCRRCLRGHQHVCAARQEVGIRGDRPGALAEQLTVPASSLHLLPDQLDPALGALVEPGGNALRAVQGAALAPGHRVLIMGPGTIGLLCALFARASGAEVHLLGLAGPGLEFARSLGLAHVWTQETLPDLPVDAIIDAAPSAELPPWALSRVEPGGRVVLIGLAEEPSRIDTRDLVLGDLTVVGVLSASPALEETIAAYADGSVDPRPLIAATIGLDEVAGVLAGARPDGAGAGPKIHIDPQRG